MVRIQAESRGSEMCCVAGCNREATIVLDGTYTFYGNPYCPVHARMHMAETDRLLRGHGA